MTDLTLRALLAVALAFCVPSAHAQSNDVLRQLDDLDAHGLGAVREQRARLRQGVRVDEEHVGRLGRSCGAASGWTKARRARGLACRSSMNWLEPMAVR